MAEEEGENAGDLHNHKKRFWNSLQSVEKRLRRETEASLTCAKGPISEQQPEDVIVLSNLAHLLACVDFGFYESMAEHAASDAQKQKLQGCLLALRKLLAAEVSLRIAALGVLLMTSNRPPNWGKALQQRLGNTSVAVFDELVAEKLLEEHTIVSSTLVEAVDLVTLSHTLGSPLHEAFARKCCSQSPTLDVFQNSKHLFLFWLARLWALQARAAAEDVCLFKINSLLPEVIDLSSDDPKSLNWKGISVQWTDEDTQACSKQFQEANLLQYLPAAPIVEAMLEVIHAMERIAAGTQDLCRKSDLYVVCVRSLSLLLLRTDIPSYMLEICKPHRGHAYTRKIVCLCHIGSVDEAFNCASTGMDDVLVNQADQLQLEQRSLSLWTKLGRKNSNNQIPETPPRRSRQSYIERDLEIPRDELVRSRQPGSSRLKFQASQDAVSVLSACVLPMRRGIQGASFESFEPRMVSEGLFIEERVLCAYQTALGPGWKGMYGENRPWVTLFFLICFDCIFDGSPLTAPREFIRTPLDLFSPTFYSRRRTKFEEQFKSMASWTKSTMEAVVLSAWHRCQDCPDFVQEGRFEAADIATLAACVGGIALSTIFRHIAKDYRVSARGFPDLVLFRLPLAGVSNVRFQNKMSDDRFSQQVQALVENRHCLLVEVKSPTDELSAYQRIWLNTLLGARIPAEVCYVSTPSVVIGR